MPRLRPFCLIAACGLMLAGSACAPPPRIDALTAPPAQGMPPVLLPLDQLLATAAQPARANDATAAALAARAARLRARVADLR